jgi:hypothetical protein
MIDRETFESLVQRLQEGRTDTVGIMGRTVPRDDGIAPADLGIRCIFGSGDTPGESIA